MMTFLLFTSNLVYINKYIHILYLLLLFMCRRSYIYIHIFVHMYIYVHRHAETYRDMSARGRESWRSRGAKLHKSLRASMFMKFDLNITIVFVTIHYIENSTIHYLMELALHHSLGFLVCFQSNLNEPHRCSHRPYWPLPP